MNKFLVVSALTLTLTLTLTLVACGSYQGYSHKAEKSPQDLEKYSGVEGSIQRQKEQAHLAQQANKLKCQGARLNLVDAEAQGDMNAIRQVKALVQKNCVAER